MYLPILISMLKGSTFDSFGKYRCCSCTGSAGGCWTGLCWGRLGLIAGLAGRNRCCTGLCSIGSLRYELECTVNVYHCLFVFLWVLWWHNCYLGSLLESSPKLHPCAFLFSKRIFLIFKPPKRFFNIINEAYTILCSHNTIFFSQGHLKAECLSYCGCIYFDNFIKLYDSGGLYAAAHSYLRK